MLIQAMLTKQGQLVSQDVLRAHNQRWSLASADIAKLPQYFANEQSLTPAHTFTAANQHMSPPTVDMAQATPSTGQSSASYAVIRCVCNIPVDDGSKMILCESCNKWLHVRCTGINAHQLPPVYVCVFCTGTTPLVRGGRVREPTRMQQHSFTSPLAGRGSNPFGG
jgi:hypothetical protein